MEDDIDIALEEEMIRDWQRFEEEKIKNGKVVSLVAKEMLYKKCQEKEGCFLSGQVGWIVEVMEEYAAYCLKNMNK